MTISAAETRCALEGPESPSREELERRINDCRIRILEELGIEAPACIRERSSHGSD